MDKYTFQLLNSQFMQQFQPRARFRILTTGNEAGSVDVSGEPSLMWATDENGIPIRIQRNMMSPTMPSGVPIWVGDVVGYSSQHSQAMGVAFQQIDNWNGETFETAWVGLPGAVGYAGADGNLTGDVEKIYFDEGDSWLRLKGETGTGHYVYDYGVNFPFLVGYAAGGTEASPVGKSSGDVLFNFSVFAYGTTGFSAASVARLRYIATENQTDTAHGNRAVLSTTKNTTVTAVAAFAVENNGQTAPLQGLAHSGVITPAAISADEDDYAPIDGGSSLPFANAVRVRLSATTPGLKITGLDSTNIINGQIVILENVDVNTIILPTNDGGSLSQNRFNFLADVPLPYEAVITIEYDTSDATWRLIGGYDSLSDVRHSNSQADVNYTLSIDDNYIGYTALSAARTVTLPPVADFPNGFTFTVADETGGAGTDNIIIDADGAELISGSGTYTIATNWGAVSIIGRLTQWIVTSKVT